MPKITATDFLSKGGEICKSNIITVKNVRTADMSNRGFISNEIILLAPLLMAHIPEFKQAFDI